MWFRGLIVGKVKALCGFWDPKDGNIKKKIGKKGVFSGAREP